MPDPAAIYEFWVNHPHSLHQMTILMTDLCIPKLYCHMHGFSSHTFSFWNQNGERFWFKRHFKSSQGVESYTNAEALNQSAYRAQKDLVEFIDSDDYPSWTAKVQVMSEQRAKDYEINPFDLTKVWPHADFPLI